MVDTGRSKERDFDRVSGVSKYEVRWISKASANQRAGRAGRTGPGHCYRLYSSAVFNNIFPKFAPPEMSIAPIEGIVLVMKRMGIDKVIITRLCFECSIRIKLCILACCFCVTCGMSRKWPWFSYLS